ncbi:MAG: hypothetical protein ACR2N1_26210 [Rubripirellula sp.]
MRLNINDGDHLESPSEAEVRKCVEDLGTDQFLVLGIEEGHFIQTYHHADGSYELEHRRGSADQHYKVDPAQITVADVLRSFSLFLAQSDALATSWDWQPISFGPDVRVVDDVEDPDAIVEYHGVLMSADWPQEIEDAQELKGYVMHGQPLNRVKHSAAGDAGEQGELCQECGVLKGQFHVPGCQQEDCPRCAGKLVECSCEIDID